MICIGKTQSVSIECRPPGLYAGEQLPSFAEVIVRFSNFRFASHFWVPSFSDRNAAINPATRSASYQPANRTSAGRSFDDSQPLPTRLVKDLGIPRLPDGILRKMCRQFTNQTCLR